MCQQIQGGESRAKNYKENEKTGGSGRQSRHGKQRKQSGWDDEMREIQTKAGWVCRHVCRAGVAKHQEQRDTEPNKLATQIWRHCD